LSSGQLKVHCNAGKKIVRHVATLRNYGTVWFNKDGIENILSMSLFKKKFPVTYDSAKGDYFIVKKPDKNIIFAGSPSGLYYHDTTNRAVMLVNTVKQNREGFTDREFDRAKSAHRALGLVGYPSPRDFKNMVRSNMIKNCNVTPIDIDNAYTLFGDDITSLRGKTVRTTPDPVMADYVEIPKEILDLNKDLTVAADIMFVNGPPFVTSISRKVKFITIEYVTSRSETNLVKSLLKIISLYKTRGFTPSTALMDREFECLRLELLTHGVNINTTAASEHVPDIERQIRLIEEHTRALRSTLPFKNIPGRMIIEMLANVVLWIKDLPPASGVSKTYSPRTIMTGTALDFNKHCQIPFGAYAEVHEDRNITNTMSERTQPSICLGPTANFQGSYKFLSLRTGKRITCKQFKELPMPDLIIKRVEAMAEREQQNKTITFSDRSGNKITNLYESPAKDTDEAAAGVYDGDHGPDDGPNNEATNEAPGIAVEQPESSMTPGVPAEDGVTSGVPAEDSVTPGVTTEDEENTDVTHHEITGVAPEGIATGTSGNERTTAPDNNSPPLRPSGTEYDSGDDDDDASANNGVETSHNEIPENQVYHPDSMTPSIQRVHGLRPRKPRDYSHMHSHATIMHHAMTQYSLKKGLKKFQKVGEAAVSNELKQLHMRETFTPQHSNDLSDSQKQKALESLMFLKEKRDGTIKGRACADVRKQR
jgi:hypothetical protein